MLKFLFSTLVVLGLVACSGVGLASRTAPRPAFRFSLCVGGVTPDLAFGGGPRLPRLGGDDYGQEGFRTHYRFLAWPGGLLGFIARPSCADEAPDLLERLVWTS